MWNRGGGTGKRQWFDPLSQNLTVLPAPSEREPLACRKLCNLPGSFAAAAKAFTPWGQISPSPGENVAQRQKGEQVAANIVSRRMRGTGKQQLAVRPHQSPAVTASPDRGKPSGTANFAVYPETFPRCQGPHPRGGCLRSRLGEFSPQSVRISAFPSLKVKNPAEKRFRWFKNRFGCAILGVKVPVWTGNRRA